jgi:Cu(I)/Ag(I) efflux system membrane fusion protein
MHPEIKKDKPGDCPICGMSLVEQNIKPSAHQNDTVSLGMLLKPTSANVLSNIPVTSLSNSAEEILIEALGTVAYNPEYNKTIAAKISGRIEKLYLKYNFQEVKAGQKVMEVYSPDLLAAQQNLLFVLNNDAQNTSLIRASRERLRLMGVINTQINQIIRTKRAIVNMAVFSDYSGHVHEIIVGEAKESMISSNQIAPLAIKEGAYITAGQSIFSVFNPHHLWALINIEPDLLQFISKGSVVKLIPEGNAGKEINGRISFIEPTIRDGNKTIVARVNFNSSNYNIPVGSQLKANISAYTNNSDWLPAESVISLGNDKIVFTQNGGAFETRLVTTGYTAGRKIEILSGLKPTEKVALNAGYLMDSESFIKVNE